MRRTLVRLSFNDQCQGQGKGRLGRQLWPCLQDSVAR